MDYKDSVRQRLDSIEKKVDNLTVLSIENKAILEEHQRRSHALESLVSSIRDNEIKDLEQFKEKVYFVFKIASWSLPLLTAIAGLAFYLIRIGGILG